MRKLFIVLLTFTILFSACGSFTSKTPPENSSTLAVTQVPSTASATKIPSALSPKTYTLRMEFSTTSDWSRLTILDSDLIHNVRLVDKQGNFEGYSVDKETILISQPTAPVLNNPNVEIKITVDFEITNNASNTAVPFLLEKGAVNNTTIRFFNISDGKDYLLLDEIVREGYVEGQTDLNPYNFTFDLKLLFQDVAALPTPTRIPALSLPVGQLTPVPSSMTKITAENAKDLQEIARYYADDVEYIARLTKDNKFLFVADGGGVDKYDYSSMTKLVHIAIAVAERSADDFKSLPENFFQNSADGNWVLINNRWLVDLRNNNQPKIRDLSAEFIPKNLYVRTISLSPDGSLLMISDRRCTETCKWDVAKIVNLSDGTKKDAPNLYGFAPTISPNGDYVAFAVEASVYVWKTSDLQRITTIKIDNPPFFPGGIAFSDTGDLIAIAQKTGIEIYNVETGNSQTSIGGLCDTHDRRVLFAPNFPVRIIETSKCDSGIWLIDQGRAAGGTGVSYDFSRIAFDKDGRVSSIPYPHPASRSIGYNDSQYFRFLDNDTFVFDGDSQSGYPNNNHSCVISLSVNSLKCFDNTQSYVNGQWLKKGQILGTDGQMYNYHVKNSTVEIRSQADSSKVYYSLPWKGYIFTIEAIDPVNKLIFYQIALDTNNNKEVVQDMENNRVLMKFEGQTFFVSIAFSEDKKYAALCQKISYSYLPGVDKLIIFDLTKKTIVYSTKFTCYRADGALALSNDGSKLAAEYVSSFSGDTTNLQVLLVDIANDFKSRRFDIETSRTLATAFTPDGNILAVMCQEDNICFLNSSDGQEISRLKAHPGITHIVFDKQGTLMATSSDWGLVSLWAVPPFAHKENP